MQALLHLLERVRDVTPINIVCAHVNHNKRIESEDEKVFVENYCTHTKRWLHVVTTSDCRKTCSTARNSIKNDVWYGLSHTKKM